MTTEAPAPILLWDDGRDAPVWRAHAADGAEARLGVDPDAAGREALRLDFALHGHGSWAILRYERPCVLPDRYVVVLRIRGDAPPTELQVKLVDPSGANVWWWRRRPFAFAPAPVDVTLRQAALEFAWGPVSGGDPRAVAAVEIALAADDERAGTLWVETLRIEPRAPETSPLAIHGVRASSAAPDRSAEHVLEASDASWCAAPGDVQPWLELDVGERREWGGMVVDGTAAGTPAMRLRGSDDRRHWTPITDAPAGPAARCWLRTADAEWRFARLDFPDGMGPGIARVTPVPLELAVSPARYATAVARRASRGAFPRHLLGEQAYWAVVGADGDDRKALLGEDGGLEIDAEAQSLEPFLWRDGRLVTWADVERRVQLADGHLPVPTVEWTAPGMTMRVTAFVHGPPGAGLLVARYELTAAAPAALRLFVAIRPYQVNPAWQSLNLVGAMAPIERLERAASTVIVNRTRRIVALSPADGFGAAPAEEGLAALRAGRVPTAERLDDPLGLAEGAFAFDVQLTPGRPQVLAVVVPLHETTAAPGAATTREDAARWADQALAATCDAWRRRLARVPIALPDGARAFSDTLRASLAWILVNRDGPRIQPGPRCYRRSWIRDGTLTGTALAEMGFADEARDFLRWYAPHQYDDGRVPCAVDRRGIDPTPEHDSHGQLVWGTVEVFRLTGDRPFLVALWPRVLAAVEAIARLRATRTEPARRGQPSFGLLPESISHEGYASRPVHSYWDDFFAVRALADAAWAAGVLGDTAAVARCEALATAMRADVRASVAGTIAAQHLDVVPGSVELGDFDPTSTAIAFDPCDVAAALPIEALARTFVRYWAEIEARRRGDAPNDAYAPYEVRNATALMRLGWPERAAALLSWLIDDQRPTAWRQWPEIAWKDGRAPRFLGDLPHGWIASSFVRALRRLLVDEHRDDGVLVLAAGVPEAWVREAPGIRVQGLPTCFGALDFAFSASGPDELVARLGGPAAPPGGFALRSPCPAPVREVVVDGQPQPVPASPLLPLPHRALEIRLRY